MWVLLGLFCFFASANGMQYGTITVQNTSSAVTVANMDLLFEYDLASGRADVSWWNQTRMIKAFYGSALLGTSYVIIPSFPSHVLVSVSDVSSNLGIGVEVTIRSMPS